MIRKLFITIAALLGLTLGASADQFWVTQYRAAPSKFPALLELLKNTPWETFEEGRPIMMRHSQGNHWDVMLLGKHTMNCDNEMCQKTMGSYNDAVRNLVDFEHTFIAKSDISWAELEGMNSENGFYHIEMFQAAAGKHAALLKERQMENDYLVRIGQHPNVIFETLYGSDVDNFTIGFYRDLAHFAESPGLTSEQFEEAAKASGFDNRAHISFLLRELLVGHHDTLAVKVQ
jgi:hypothetical protein